MGQKRTYTIEPPVGGIDRALSLQRQPPFTTPNARNVRPFDIVEKRGRIGTRPPLAKAFNEDLGGPVQMLTSVKPQVGATSWVSDTAYDSFDAAAFSSNWTQASTLSWTGYTTALDKQTGRAELISSSTQNPSGATGGLLYSSISGIGSPVNSYTVSLEVNGQIGGTGIAGYWDIYALMTAASPDPTSNCLRFRVVFQRASGGTYGYDWYLHKVVSGTATLLDSGSFSNSDPVGTLALKIVSHSAETCEAYAYGTQLTSTPNYGSTFTGRRVGFGMNSVVPSAGFSAYGIIQTEAFRVTANAEISANTNRIVAICDGALWREFTGGSLTVKSSNYSFRTSGPIRSVFRGDKLYIADCADEYVEEVTDGSGSITNGVLTWTQGSPVYETLIPDEYNYVAIIKDAAAGAKNGTFAITDRVNATGCTLKYYTDAGVATAYDNAWNGTCNVIIARCMKIYSPTDDSILPWTSTLNSEGDPAGIVPPNCSLIALFLDRIYLSGDPKYPHLWYASRISEPRDFDYSPPDPTDPGRAVASENAQSGVIGEPITAMFAEFDDYLMFGTRTQMWRQEGDPTVSGIINVSRDAGIIDFEAWCSTGENEIVSMSRMGVYVTPPGGTPVPLSREKIPDELIDIDTNAYRVLMAWNGPDRGIHLYIVSRTGTPIVIDHWFIHWVFKGFWADRLSTSHTPTALYAYIGNEATPSIVLHGGYDGYVRYPTRSAATDDGTAVDSFLWIGPMRASGDDYSDGSIRELIAVMGRESGDVTWEVYVGQTPEECMDESNTVFASGTWSDGLNGRVNPEARGPWFAIKVSDYDGSQWYLERISAKVEQLGLLRVAS